MAGRDARGGAAGVKGRHVEDAEMHEDGDFTDLPVHFQPLEAEGHRRTGVTQPIIATAVQHHGKAALMDAGTQYFDSSIIMNPTFAPTLQVPPQPLPTSGRSETGCQYSPSLFPDPLSRAMDSAGLYTSSYSSTGQYSNGALFDAAATEQRRVGQQDEGGPRDNSSDVYRPSIPCASDMAGNPGNHRFALTSANGCEGAVNGTLTQGSNTHFKDACVGSSEQTTLVSGEKMRGDKPGLSSSGSQTTGQPKAGLGSEQPSKRFQCPECETSFTRLDHLHRHLKTKRAHFQTITEDKKYHTCPLCSKVFTRNDHMKRHIKIHARGEPVMCVECQSWFPSKTELTHHLLLIHRVVVFECNLCSKGFFEAMYLTRHLHDKHHLVVTGDGGLKPDPNIQQPSTPTPGIQLPYRCGICSLNFVRESACSKHMLSHTRHNGPSVDSLALAASHLAEVSEPATLAQLQPHLWSPNTPWHSDKTRVNNSNGLAASACSSSHPEKGFGMVMSSLGLYPGQDVKAEPEGSVRPLCQKENKRFVDKGVTARDGMERQAYLCGVCGLGFERAQELKSHLRMHTGQHRFACVECGANFASSSNLIRHQRTHTGERPFHCSLCAAAFTHKGALVNHERIHTGERPYVCDLCEAAFARVDALTRHKRTHKENQIKEEEEEGAREIFVLRG